MLRLHANQTTLWDAILPEQLKTLPEELAKVDALLDDDRFLEPFLQTSRTKFGRPTVPIEIYLRLMYLKFRYQLGYETLVSEVDDSITWRRFCRLNLGEKVPDASTLIKARKRYGEETVERLNEALVRKLTEQKMIRHRKFRTDTTVIESDIHHPTDASLLRDGVKVITRIVRSLRSTASHAVAGFEDKTESVKEKILSFSKVLRRRTQTSWEEVNKITHEVIEITESVCEKAKEVLSKLKESTKKSVENKQRKLESAVQLTGLLLEQAKQVVEGNRRLPARIISFHDPQARPIQKGKLSKPTEFGYKVRIDETESGFVTGYQVYESSPPDEHLLLPAVEQHIRLFGEAPHAVATDRGFASSNNETELSESGVQYISIPARGKKSKKRAEHEQQLWFRNLQRFRAGGEAKISLLKRKYGLNRSRFRGLAGTESWVGYGILAHNLHRAAKLT